MHKFPVHKVERPAFPSLWECDTPPETLYFRGRPEALSLLERLPESGLAIVGTRSAQLRSLAEVSRVVGALHDTGLIILSGLALGVDTRAHESAIQAGLPTIGVMASGIDLLYPSANERLATRILETGGLLATEFPPGSDLKPHQFLQRNRLIAAWAKATWMVEASERSGALNTAYWARKQNRQCYATPCFPGDQRLVGNQLLLDRDHAEALWGPHSLGSAWLDLAGLGLKPRRARSRDTGVDDCSRLVRELRARTETSSGARVEALLEWALSAGWEPARFFATLKQALERPGVSERNGVLIST